MAIKDTYVDVESWTNLFLAAKEECTDLILGEKSPASVCQAKTLEKVQLAHTRTPRTKKKANPALEMVGQLPGSIFDDELWQYLDAFVQQQAERYAELCVAIDAAGERSFFL